MKFNKTRGKNVMQRIFHPIGQGAFYSERHENFNTVYDCGDLKDTKFADKIVKQSFDTNESIDILFISHFDCDHVSKIGTLKKHCRKIKNVILPLLYKDEKLILTNFYRLQKRFDIMQLVDNPSEYFGNGTKIIYVKSDNNPENIGGEETTNLDELKNESVIKSGIIVTEPNLDWIYIPFNWDYGNRNEKLVKTFISEGLDVEKFKEDLDYAYEHRKEIKKIYDKVDGKINQNSMMVYSGPLENFSNRRKLYHRYNFHYYAIIVISIDKRKELLVFLLVMLT